VERARGPSGCGVSGVNVGQRRPVVDPPSGGFFPSAFPRLSLDGVPWSTPGRQGPGIRTYAARQRSRAAAGRRACARQVVEIGGSTMVVQVLRARSHVRRGRASARASGRAGRWTGRCEVADWACFKAVSADRFSQSSSYGH